MFMPSLCNSNDLTVGVGSAGASRRAQTNAEERKWRGVPVWLVTGLAPGAEIAAGQVDSMAAASNSSLVQPQGRITAESRTATCLGSR